jgi:hypothetical protein
MKRAFRRAGTPLACYYAVTLALPLANGAGGSAFLKHALVVFAVPPALIMLFYVARTTVVLPFRRKPAASKSSILLFRNPTTGGSRKFQAVKSPTRIMDEQSGAKRVT